MLNKILPNCLKEDYKYHLGDFNNKSFAVFGNERVNLLKLFAGIYIGIVTFVIRKLSI